MANRPGQLYGGGEPSCLRSVNQTWTAANETQTSCPEFTVVYNSTNSELEENIFLAQRHRL